MRISDWSSDVCSSDLALIHHVVRNAGIPTRMGGNIGLPILAQDPLPAGGVYVLELSSYQIDLTYSLDADVSLLLINTPDHLNHYVGFPGICTSMPTHTFAERHLDQLCAITGRYRWGPV